MLSFKSSNQVVVVEVVEEVGGVGGGGVDKQKGSGI